MKTAYLTGIYFFFHKHTFQIKYKNILFNSDFGTKVKNNEMFKYKDIRILVGLGNGPAYDKKEVSQIR